MPCCCTAHLSSQNLITLAHPGIVHLPRAVDCTLLRSGTPYPRLPPRQLPPSPAAALPPYPSPPAHTPKPAPLPFSFINPPECLLGCCSPLLPSSPPGRLPAACARHVMQDIGAAPGVVPRPRRARRYRSRSYSRVSVRLGNG